MKLSEVPFTRASRAAVLAAAATVLAMVHIGATSTSASAACDSRPSLSWWYESSATEVTMVFGVSNPELVTVTPAINFFEPSRFNPPLSFMPGHTVGAFSVTLEPSVDPQVIWFLDCGDPLVLDTTALPAQNKLPVFSGPQGPQGPQGVEGPQGPQGVEGPQGPQGAQGIQGLPGAAGADGAAGPAGADGAAGPAGPAGPQGPMGTQGERGATGATGPAGVNGADGAAGAPGDPGETGALGAQGPAGPAGASGMPGWALPVTGLLAGLIGGVAGAALMARRVAG